MGIEPMSVARKAATILPLNHARSHFRILAIEWPIWVRRFLLCFQAERANLGSVTITSLSHS
jgi:hypothetical protein